MEAREMTLATSPPIRGDNPAVMECSWKLRDMGLIGEDAFGFRRTSKFLYTRDYEKCNPKECLGGI